MEQDEVINKNLAAIGELIARKRHEAGEKQDNVAKATGIPQAELSKIESGRYTSLKYSTLLKICAYLKIQPNEFPST